MLVLLSLALVSSGTSINHSPYCYTYIDIYICIYIYITNCKNLVVNISIRPNCWTLNPWHFRYSPAAIGLPNESFLNLKFSLNWGTQKISQIGSNGHF